MKSKTGPHPIPMDNLVAEILKHHCEKLKRGRIFTKWKPNSITHRWIRLMRQLKMTGRLHDLRHTFASYLTMSGEKLERIQMLLGHSQLSTTQIYTHLQPDYLHDSISKMSKWHKISTQSKLEIVSQ